MLDLIASRVEPGIFYDVYRPLLAGFYPEGIVLQGARATLVRAVGLSRNGQSCKSGVDAAHLPAWVGDADDEGPGDDVMVRPKGPSAGQSAVFILLDLFLGVGHTGEPKSFQDEMLGIVTGTSVARAASN